jgi:hypothetical protein
MADLQMLGAAVIGLLLVSWLAVWLARGAK